MAENNDSTNSNSNDGGDDSDSLDSDQLQEYREELEALGSFPDKVTINALSMIAEDYADQPRDAEKLYGIVRSRLLEPAPPETVLPVLYVLDSVLKNAGGGYLRLAEQDAATWMPTVHARLRRSPAAQQQKLERVWRTWNEPFRLFDAAAWRAMGRCFLADTGSTARGKLGGGGGGGSNTTATAAATTQQSTTTAAATATAGGIARTADGSLILSKRLREEMQNMLDDMQEGLSNELDKVSLERLADVNPDLLANIRAEAERAVFGSHHLNNSGSSNRPHHQRQHPKASELPPFLTDPRSDRVRQRAEEWSPATAAAAKASSSSSEPLLATVSDSVAPSLRQLVAAATADSDDGAAVLYTQSEALQVTRYLAAAATTQRLLAATVEQARRQPLLESASASSQQPAAQAPQSAAFAVDRAQFTSDGIKRRNRAAIGWLYEIGLPFQSRADGRRFRTQLALSRHLDALFRRRQRSKQQSPVAAAPAERGWYLWDRVWTREETAAEPPQDAAGTDADDNNSENNNNNNNDSAAAAAERSTFLADEARDRCVVCGLRFGMFFDADGDGVYKYRNCREIAVQNGGGDDDSGSDPQLVHATCWSGLGEPEALTADQTLQDLLVHQQQQ